MTDTPGLPSPDDAFLRAIPPVEGIISALADEDQALDVCLELDLALEPVFNGQAERVRVKALIIQCIEHPDFFATEHGCYLLSMVVREQDKFTLNELASIQDGIRSACATFKSDEWIFGAGTSSG